MAQRAPENLIALAGDWHGAGDWAAEVVRAVAERGIGILYHVGDFGIWPGEFGARYLAEVEAACAAHGVEMWVTPGNHEDWSRLVPLFEAAPNDPSPVSEHIWVLPPGFRWQRAGRSLLSLGGAPTLSFEKRTLGLDWWPEEELTEHDVARAIAGGPVDVMISHDGPEGGTDEMAAMIASNPFGFSARAQAYAAIGRERLTRAFHGVRPRLLAHGHYHTRGLADRQFQDVGGTWQSRILTLDRERREGNTALLDLTDYSVQPLPV